MNPKIAEPTDKVPKVLQQTKCVFPVFILSIRYFVRVTVGLIITRFPKIGKCITWDPTAWVKT